MQFSNLPVRQAGELLMLSHERRLYVILLAEYRDFSIHLNVLRHNRIVVEGLPCFPVCRQAGNSGNLGLSLLNCHYYCP